MAISTESFDNAAASFKANGYVRIDQLLSSDILDLVKTEIGLITENAHELPTSLVWFAPSSKGGELVQRICRMNEHSRLIDDIGRSSPLMLKLARRLLGVDNIVFADGTMGDYGAMLIIKDPGNLSSWQDLGWHQDTQFTSHLPIHPFINVGIYLDNADEVRGQLTVLPGSHKEEPVLFNQQLADTVDYHPGEMGLSARAGDVVVHSSRLWHCSRQYTSACEGQRRILYFKFFPESM